MAQVQDFELDDARLDRRIKFLRSRANAHLELRDDPVTRRACAGCLLRDAAATALLLNRAEDARELFAEAGRLWIDIGLFAGFSLVALSHPEPWWGEHANVLSRIEALLEAQEKTLSAEDVSRSLEPLLREAGERLEDEAKAPRYLTGSAASTRQLLHLHQALLLGAQHGIDRPQALLGRLRKRLELAPTAPVGPTSIPLRSYMHVLDASAVGDFGRDALDGLTSLVLRRTEQLEAAKADRHHWAMALQPADLVDLDLLSVIVAGLDGRGFADRAVEVFRDRSALVRLPLDAARCLRPNPDELPPERFR